MYRFLQFFKNKRKVCENSEIRQKKSHELNIVLCDLKLNQNGPLHMGIGLIQYGVDWKSRFGVSFFLTQFVQISKYLRNLAGRRILEGHNANLCQFALLSHGVSMELTRLSQRNTNLRLLFNIYKTRKNPSQTIIDKFRAISGILCVLCIFVVLYVKFY